MEAQPFNVVLDGLYVFDIFFYRVRVIEAQVALPLIILGNAKIQANRLGVTNMQIAIWLRRKTGANTGVLPVRQVFINDLTNKVSWAGFSLTHRGFLKACTLVNGV